MLAVTGLRSAQTLPPWGRELRSFVCFGLYSQSHLCARECDVSQLVVNNSLLSHMKAHRLCIQYRSVKEPTKSWRRTIHRDLHFPASNTPDPASEASNNELMSSSKRVKWGRMINCAITLASKHKLQLTSVV